MMLPTWRLLCSSFLGSILQPLIRKQVTTKKELHRSLQVSAIGIRLLTSSLEPRFRLLGWHGPCSRRLIGRIPARRCTLQKCSEPGAPRYFEHGAPMYPKSWCPEALHFGIKAIILLVLWRSRNACVAELQEPENVPELRMPSQHCHWYTSRRCLPVSRE